jgi:hypothetical protein
MLQYLRLPHVIGASGAGFPGNTSLVWNVSPRDSVQQMSFSARTSMHISDIGKGHQWWKLTWQHISWAVHLYEKVAVVIQERIINDINSFTNLSYEGSAVDVATSSVSTAGGGGVGVVSHDVLLASTT